MSFTGDNVMVRRKTNYILVTESDGVAILRWVRLDTLSGGRRIYKGQELPQDVLWAEPSSVEEKYRNMGWRVRWEL